MSAPTPTPLPAAPTPLRGKAHWLGSNLTTVKLGAGGKVSIRNANGSTHVVVDVVGWYAKDNTPTNRNGGQYEWLPPSREFDTRTDPSGKPTAGRVLQYSLDFGDRNPHIKALVFNLTAVAPEKAGFLTAWSGVTAQPPTSSTVNYGVGVNVPNMAYVQTTPCTTASADAWCTAGAPKFKIYTSAAAHVLTDLVGVVDDGYSPFGMRFKPMSPTRIVDSRTNQDITGPLGAGGVGRVDVPAAMLTADTGVVSINVTAIKPTANTVVTVWPVDNEDVPSKPSTSNLNPYANQIVSNGVLAIVEPANAFNVHNLSGDMHLVADVVGTFYYPPATAALAGEQPSPGGVAYPISSSQR